MLASFSQGEKMRVGLIVIDGQKDFCDIGPGQDFNGNLAVPGSSVAMEKVNTLIKRAWKDIDELNITFDAHFPHHIAHARMWVDKDGQHPSPFTQIKLEDVLSDRPIWFASNPFGTWQMELVDYLKGLNDRNDEREKIGLPRIEHTIWPEHCIPDSIGFSLQEKLREAVYYWEDRQNRPAKRIPKGSYIFREHFSAFRAEVFDIRAPDTKPQLHLAEKIIQNLDMMIWAGIAEDYCLMNSFIDFIEILSGGDEDKKKSLASKMVFLEDGTAAVGAVPSLRQFFHDYMSKYGVCVTTTEKVLS